MQNSLKLYWESFINLIYPRMCVVCDSPLVKGENQLCSECMYHIQRTNYHLDKKNPITELFYGHDNIEFATSHFGFDKGGIFQEAVHALKYKNNPEIGTLFGTQMGIDLKASPYLPALDYIVPVPLHKKKLKLRGYNQSEAICEGLAAALQVNIDTKSLKRKVHSSSQTRLTKEERWNNVANNFMVVDKERLKNKHILLVDDVLTTGATLESCIKALNRIEGIKISIATLARAT